MMMGCLTGAWFLHSQAFPLEVLCASAVWAENTKESQVPESPTLEEFLFVVGERDDEQGE